MHGQAHDALALSASLILLQIGIFALVAFGVVPPLISRMTGWADLARRFPFSSAFHGLKWNFQSAQMRHWANYNNCLTVGANTEGLYLKAPWILRAHPPLFIPWQEISMSETKILFRPMIRLELGCEQPVPFTIRESLADQIKHAAGNGWPVEHL